jgi:hypothetical protein
MRVGRRGGPSQRSRGAAWPSERSISQKVRDYLAEHPDAGPTDVATALNRYGVSVALVSSVKGKNRTGRRKKRKATRRSVRGTDPGRRTSRTEPVVAAAELIRATAVESAQ